MTYLNKALLIRPQLVQDGTGDGIHSAVDRATGGAVVFESHAHLVSQYKVVYASNSPARMGNKYNYSNYSTIS